MPVLILKIASNECRLHTNFCRGMRSCKRSWGSCLRGGQGQSRCCHDQSQVSQVHPLGHGEDLEGWNLACRWSWPLESQWPGQWWSGPTQTWPGPTQSITGPSSGALGGPRRPKFGMQVVLTTRKSVTRQLVIRADPDMASASLEWHKSIFRAMGGDRRLKLGMQVVLATREPMTRPVAVRGLRGLGKVVVAMKVDAVGKLFDVRKGIGVIKVVAAGKGGYSNKGGCSGKGGCCDKRGYSAKGGCIGKWACSNKGVCSGKGVWSGKQACKDKSGCSRKGGCTDKCGCNGKGSCSNKVS